MYVNKVGYSELYEILERLSKSKIKRSLLILGEPGIGKSSIVYNFAIENGYRLIDIRLAEYEPADILGIPIPQKSKKNFTYLPLEFLARACKEKCILFLDELFQADPAVLRAVFRIVLDRRLADGTKFHQDTLVVAAANDNPEDNWVSIPRFGLLDRFIVVKLNFDPDEWLEKYAFQRFNSVIYNFLRSHKNMILSKTGEVRLTPRRWEWVSEYYDQFGKEGIKDLIPEPVFQTFEEWLEKEMKDFSDIVKEIFSNGNYDKWRALSISEKNRISELIINEVGKVNDISNLRKFLSNIEKEIAAKIVIAIMKQFRTSQHQKWELFKEIMLDIIK